jgi:hypothetical protein
MTISEHAGDEACGEDGKRLQEMVLLFYDTADGRRLLAMYVIL